MAGTISYNGFVEQNGIQMLDEPFKFNEAEDTLLRQQKPWHQDPHYFTVSFCLFAWFLQDSHFRMSKSQQLP